MFYQNQKTKIQKKLKKFLKIIDKVKKPIKNF